MVHKAIAGVGALLTGIGLILLIVISVTEDFVIATIPGTPCTEDNPIGTLGVFTSTFDPACAQGTGIEELESYNLLSKSESPTTEFWPLFPAQNNFGDALGDSPPEFTTCEEFYAADGAMDSLALSVATSTVINGLNDSMVEGFGETGTLLGLVGPNLHGALQAIAFASFTTEVPGALATLKSTSQGAIGLLDVIYGTFLARGCAESSATAVLPVYDTTCDGLEPVVSVTGSYDVAVLVGTEASGADAFTAPFYAAVEGALSLDPGTGSATVKQLCGVLALHNTFGLLTTRAARPLDVFGGAAAIPDTSDLATDFAAVLADLTTMSGAGPAFPASLRSALRLLNLCTGSTSVATCTDPTVFLGGAAAPLLNDATPVDFCFLANETGAIIVPDGDACDYKDILEGLAALPIATLQAQLAAVPGFEDAAESLDASTAAGLGVLVTGCSAFPIDMTTCVNNVIAPAGAISPAEQFWGIPASWTSVELGLCNLLGLQGASCGATKNFRGFVNAQIAILTGLGENSTAGAFTLVFNVLCAGADSVNACLVAASTTVPSNMSGTSVSGAPLVNNVYDRLTVPATSAADRIAACEDDNTDIEVFETAQAMIPASMAFAALGAILAGVAAALNKTPVAAVAAVFALTGGALTVGALLYIRTAPVYDLVGKEPEDFVPLYSASTGQLLGLLGGVLPLIGAVAIAISAFLNRPGSSSEMTSKVDNTY